MQNYNLKIVDNIKQGEDYFVLHLLNDNLPNFIPGQFINISIPGKYLNRPISICNQEANVLTLAIKRNGEGTNILANLKQNDCIKAILPLGNGIDLNEFEDEILMIGGGIGVAPLLLALKKAKEQGLKTTCVLGFSCRKNTLLLDEFKKYSNNLYISYDEDKKNVVDLVLEHDLASIKAFCCGPIVMMKALDKVLDDAYFSLETRMGCGFGTCMGCSCGFKSGQKRICKEGPVFKKDDIIWENLM